MKTIITHIQKEGVKLLTVSTTIFATLFLLSAQGSVTGSKSFYNNEHALPDITKDEIAYSSFTGNEASIAISLKYLEKEKESDMEIENWMTETENFDAIPVRTSTGEDLNLEAWMFNDSIFTTTNMSMETETFSEAKPAMQNQKVDVKISDSKTDSKTPLLYEMDETELKFESWMFDKSIWNTINQTSVK